MLLGLQRHFVTAFCNDDIRLRKACESFLAHLFFKKVGLPHPKNIVGFAIDDIGL